MQFANPLVLATAAILSLTGCGELARITFVPNLSAAEFAHSASEVCVATYLRGDPSLAAHSDAINASEGPYRVRNLTGGFIAAHADRDAIYQISRIGKTDGSDGEEGVRCAFGADVNDSQLVLSEIQKALPFPITLQMTTDRGVVAFEASTRVNGRTIDISVLPEGGVVLSRTEFEFGQANDYRFVTFVAEWQQ